MGQKRYEMDDEQLEQIKDMFQHSKMGRPPKDERLMLNASLWIARSGARWSVCPNASVPTKPYTATSASGVMTGIFRKLNAKAEVKELNIDSTSIKAHPQSVGAKKGL